MDLILHQPYTFDEAIASFTNGVSPEFFCRNDFAVFPSAVVCLATLGPSSSEASLPSPSSLTWKRPDYQAALPGKVVDVLARNLLWSRRLKDHHLFLRLQGDEPYIYAGPAHLVSYGGADYSADFTLLNKLPRDLWVRLGGYAGWLLEVNHKMYRVESGDLGGYRRLCGLMTSREYAHFCMTRYEEDSLSLYTNLRRGWLMYLREPSDTGIYTRDTEYAGDPKAAEIFRCICGIDLEFRASKTLPRSLALQAAEEFFLKGVLPRCVPWDAKK